MIYRHYYILKRCFVGSSVTTSTDDSVVATVDTTTPFAETHAIYDEDNPRLNKLKGEIPSVVHNIPLGSTNTKSVTI